MYALGVDLGTTFSAAAVATDDGVQIVDLSGRGGAVPSVVYFGAGSHVLVGEAAERRAAAEPDRVAREVKRRLGDPIPVVLGGVPFSVESVMATTLREIVRLVTERQGGAPASVCLTHPANWGAYRRELFGHVAEIAELPVSLTLTEPAAAAAWHAKADRVPVGSSLVVYDLGGGTFDAVVMRKVADGFELLGEPKGLEHLGGLNFDAALLALVDEALEGAISKLDPTDPGSVLTMARLRSEVVTAKEILSSDVAVSIPVPTDAGWQEVRVTRREFEQRIEPLVEQTIDVLDAALAGARVSAGDVTSVLLVGGSSRVPLVAEMVRRRLTVATTVDEHPKHVVALGAALHAWRRLGGDTVDPTAPQTVVTASPPSAPPPSPPPPSPPPAAPPQPAPPPPPAEVTAATGPLPVVASSPAPKPPPEGQETGRVLVILGGEDGGRRIPLGEGRITVGRDPGPAGILLRDRHASRSHAHVEVSDDGVQLIDNGSLNGTYVEGRAVEAASFGPDQFVRIGTTLLTLFAGHTEPNDDLPLGGATVIAPSALRRDRPVDRSAPSGRVVLPAVSPVDSGTSRFRRRSSASALTSYPELVRAMLPQLVAQHHRVVTERRRAAPTAVLAARWGPGPSRWAASPLTLTLGFADQPSRSPLEVPPGLSRADAAAVVELLEPFARDAAVPAELPLTPGLVLEVAASADYGRRIANEAVVQLALRYGPALADIVAVRGAVNTEVEPWVDAFVSTPTELVPRLASRTRPGPAIAVLHGGAEVDEVVSHLAATGAVVIRHGGRRPASVPNVALFTVDEESGLAVLDARQGITLGEVLPATLAVVGLQSLV